MQSPSACCPTCALPVDWERVRVRVREAACGLQINPTGWELLRREVPAIAFLRVFLFKQLVISLDIAQIYQVI